MAVSIAAFVQLRVGKELKDDPEHQRLLASGELLPPEKSTGAQLPPVKNGAKASSAIFMGGVALAVLADIFKELRTVGSVGFGLLMGKMFF